MTARPKPVTVLPAAIPSAARRPFSRMLRFLKTRFQKKDHAPAILDYREVQNVIERRLYHESLFQSYYPVIR